MEGSQPYHDIAQHSDCGLSQLNFGSKKQIDRSEFEAWKNSAFVLFAKDQRNLPRLELVIKNQKLLAQRVRSQALSDYCDLIICS